jgi:hypothetical protein
MAGRQCVYYTDTDSLFTNKIGYERLNRKGYIDNNAIGKLKLEGTSNRITIFGPKDYEFGMARVTKGIRKNAVALCGECGQPLSGRRGAGCSTHITENVSSYRQVQFEGIKGVLRRENSPHIDVSTVVKTLKREYLKGTISADGWTEYPVLTLDH